MIKSILDFRLNIDDEFQGWILLFVTITIVWLLCLPCYCAGLSFAPARRFAAWLSGQLPVFYIFMGAFTVAWLFLVLKWLPDWNFPRYMQVVLAFFGFLVGHVLKYATSVAMIAAFCVAVTFKDRIALILGLDHTTLFKCKMRDCLTCWNPHRFKPIELNVWKVEDLFSGDLFAANNVYVEFYLGYNEPVRTRVHNNAGSGCLLKESLQVNYDEGDEDEKLFIFVRNQQVMGAWELARAELPSQKLRELLRDSSRGPLQWEAGVFGEPISLHPRGRLWLRASPVTEEDYVVGTLMQDLVTSC